ncbi:MAG: hypothetical protein E7190_14520 [Erysipelotrichaceae bacterium]|nr:hypothetical protein [Erysipelotrichaceae bacterium]
MSKKKKKLSKQPKSRTLRETAQKQQGPQTPVSAAPAVSSSQSVRFHPAVICAAVFFWYETVLKFSIGNPQWWPSLVHVFFFKTVFAHEC